jgi:EAL domain-containing protein (putative c-di-GMP-specific phosphodiesterase class I)
LELENDLRKALENHELHLHYQPILSLVDDKVTGFEALLRWDHKQRGKHSTGRFHSHRRRDRVDHPHRPLGAGKGLPAGHAVAEPLPLRPGVAININISGKQFTQPDLMNSQQVLQDTG